MQALREFMRYKQTDYHRIKTVSPDNGSRTALLVYQPEAPDFRFVVLDDESHDLPVIERAARDWDLAWSRLEDLAVEAAEALQAGLGDILVTNAALRDARRRTERHYSWACLASSGATT